MTTHQVQHDYGGGWSGRLLKQGLKSINQRIKEGHTVTAFWLPDGRIAAYKTNSVLCAEVMGRISMWCLGTYSELVNDEILAEDICAVETQNDRAKTGDAPYREFKTEHAPAFNRAHMS